MRFVKPLDREAILSAAHDHSCLVTVEENAIAGGAGSGINETLLASGISIPILNIGLSDAFIQHGTRGECLRQASLDAEGHTGDRSRISWRLNTAKTNRPQQHVMVPAE